MITMKKLIAVFSFTILIVGCAGHQATNNKMTETDRLNDHLENQAMIRSVENQVFNAGPGMPF